MREDNIRPEEWIRQSEMNRLPQRPRVEPKVDKEASDILGERVVVNDPRLIKAVASLAKHRDPNDLNPHSYLQNKEAFKEAYRKARR